MEWSRSWLSAFDAAKDNEMPCILPFNLAYKLISCCASTGNSAAEHHNMACKCALIFTCFIRCGMSQYAWSLSGVLLLSHYCLYYY